MADRTLLENLTSLPGIGGMVGLAGGILNAAFGGNEQKRIEDEITTEARKKLNAAQQAILASNPVADAKAADMQLAQQQGAAVQNALNASASQNANQGMGGDIGFGAAAINNSTAAIGASAGFAGARAQNWQHSTEMQQQRARDLNQNAADYGAQAAQVNLVNRQKQNFGSQLGNSLLGGIAGAGTGVGVISQLEQVINKQKNTIKYDPKTGLPISE